MHGFSDRSKRRWMLRGSIGPLVLLTALEVEYQCVRSFVRDPQTRRHPAGTLFESGRIDNGAEVVIAVTGQGNHAAAVLAERAVAMFRPPALLFVGVAGALTDDISRGDVVVATKVYAYHGGTEQDDAFVARPRAWDAPHDLEQVARHVARTNRWHERAARFGQPAVHFRPIAAGEAIIDGRESALALRLRSTYADAAAIEMEGAGVALAAHLNRSLPVLMIRGISDSADGEKAAADRAGGQALAASHAAAFAIALLAELHRLR